MHALHGNDRRAVVQEVIRTLDSRRDGELPLDVPGVTEIFGDAEALLPVLQTKWYATLVSAVEHELLRPIDPEMAVVAGWQRAAAQLPGVRLVLDRALAEHDALGDADHPVRRALAKEHQMLAVMAGVEPAVPGTDPALVALGRELEHVARVTTPAVRHWGWRPHLPGYTGLLTRLRAVVAA